MSLNQISGFSSHQQSDQQLDEHGYWIGCPISYKRQPELKETYRDISERIAAFLHQKAIMAQ
ncbi:solid-state culture-specific ATP-grasp domain protein [Aspergillus lentulus]|nr:solid-state culture-specific ATP-grasp domain protein [Aspergillus lentulus]